MSDKYGNYKHLLLLSDEISEMGKLIEKLTKHRKTFSQITD